VFVIVLWELNKLLSIETQKNTLGSLVLNNMWDYLVVNLLWTDYYLIPQSLYLQAESVYNTTNSGLATKESLLVSYENQLKSYWLSLDSVNSVTGQINEKSVVVSSIEIASTNEIALFLWYKNLYNLLFNPFNEVKNDVKNIILPKYKVNQEVFYKNWW
jgi:hypothetical protein